MYENRIVLQFALPSAMQEVTGIMGKDHTAFAQLRRSTRTFD